MRYLLRFTLPFILVAVQPAIGLCKGGDAAQASIVTEQDSMRVRLCGFYQPHSTCSGDITLVPSSGFGIGGILTQDRRPNLAFSAGIYFSHHDIADNEELFISVEDDYYSSSDWSLMKILLTGRYLLQTATPLKYWGEGALIMPMLIGNDENNISGIGFGVSAGMLLPFAKHWQLIAKASYGYFIFGGCTVNGKYGSFKESLNCNSLSISVGICTPAIFSMKY